MKVRQLIERLQEMAEKDPMALDSDVELHAFICDDMLEDLEENDGILHLIGEGVSKD